MEPRRTCLYSMPALPEDLECERPPDHDGPHQHGRRTWTSDDSRREYARVHHAQLEAAERASAQARREVLGEKPRRGSVVGLVGNRAQRRASMRRR